VQHWFLKSLKQLLSLEGVWILRMLKKSPIEGPSESGSHMRLEQRLDQQYVRPGTWKKTDHFVHLQKEVWLDHNCFIQNHHVLQQCHLKGT
jgi:hypothetical protein